jgi:hypothetical protein
MVTLLEFFDFVVLLLLVVRVPQALLKNEARGLGSLALTSVLLLVLIVFGVVSFSACMLVVETSSAMSRFFVLVVLLGMMALLSIFSRDRDRSNSNR